jgi:hypothetical protein
MITTTEILQTIPTLPQEDCFCIAETLLQRLQTQTAPTRDQVNQQLKIAAFLAVDDYNNDSELTALTVLDGDDFYEYE